jgi:hypothetical protein
MIVDRRFRGAYCLMMEAVRTSETSIENHFTRQYNPEENFEHHTRRRENLKSHILKKRRKLLTNPTNSRLGLHYRNEDLPYHIAFDIHFE